MSFFFILNLSLIINLVEHCFNAEDIMLKYVPQKITQYIYLKERGGKWSSKLIAAMGLLLLKAMM